MASEIRRLLFFNAKHEPVTAVVKRDAVFLAGVHWRHFSSFADYMIKLSVSFGTEKLPGLSRNGPLASVRRTQQ